jgi:hypothetical protein
MQRRQKPPTLKPFLDVDPRTRPCMSALGRFLADHPEMADSPRLHPRQMSFTIQVIIQSSAASTSAFGAG